MLLKLCVCAGGVGRSLGWEEFLELQYTYRHKFHCVYSTQNANALLMTCTVHTVHQMHTQLL